MRPIYGKDCVLRIKVDSFYYPLLCATDFSVEVVQDIIEATTVGTGTWRQYRPVGLSSWTASLNGLTKVNNNDGQIAWFYVFREQVRGIEQEIELEYKDDVGNKQFIRGSVVVPDMSLQASVNDFVSGSIRFQGTGAPELSSETSASTPSIPSLPSIACEVQPTLAKTLAEDSLTMTVIELTAQNAEALWLAREGLVYWQTSSPPVNRQFRVNYSTGVITFSNPGNPGGEEVEIGWQITS